MRKVTRIALSVMVAAVFSGGITNVVAAEEGCSPCHFCPSNQNYRQVIPQGVSTLESPDEFIRLECYVTCPGIHDCEDTEDTPEAQLADAALALGWVAPEDSSPFHFESGLGPPGPRLIRSRCGVRLTGLPIFTDLIASP